MGKKIEVFFMCIFSILLLAVLTGAFGETSNNPISRVSITDYVTNMDGDPVADGNYVFNISIWNYTQPITSFTQILNVNKSVIKFTTNRTIMFNDTFCLTVDWQPTVGTWEKDTACENITISPYTQRATVADDIDVVGQILGDWLQFDGTNWVRKALSTVYNSSSEIGYVATTLYPTGNSTNEILAVHNANMNSSSEIGYVATTLYPTGNTTAEIQSAATGGAAGSMILKHSGSGSTNSTTMYNLLDSHTFSAAEFERNDTVYIVTKTQASLSGELHFNITTNSSKGVHTANLITGPGNNYIVTETNLIQGMADNFYLRANHDERGPGTESYLESAFNMLKPDWIEDEWSIELRGNTTGVGALYWRWWVYQRDYL